MEIRRHLLLLSIILISNFQASISNGAYVLINIEQDLELSSNDITALEDGSRMGQNVDTESQLESSVARFVQYQPRHVHISYGNSSTEMFITWSTINKISTATVEYGINSIDEHFIQGTSTLFQDTGKLHLTQYIHRVALTGLVPGTIYRYHCGSDLGWSDVFTFQAMPSGTNWSPRFAIFGDMGNVNAKSLTRLQREVQLGYYNALIHVGDFAYDMNSDDGRVGDSFMDQIEPVASLVPYMTCPGNHEEPDNFLHYKRRFTMPGNSESMYYSWNAGPIHFISVSTEFYYYLKYGIKPLLDQYDWLERDLLEATSPQNRTERPWIIVYGHRPMYCSNKGCTNVEALTRVGIPITHWFGMENLFMDSGVDLVVWAHEHSYERLWPIYDYGVFNGSLEEPYRNPRALVHITTGSAGCGAAHDPFDREKPDWSAFRSLDYGYTRLLAKNKTHLYLEQVSDDQDGKVIDSFTLIREKHDPYPIPPPF